MIEEFSNQIWKNTSMIEEFSNKIWKSTSFKFAKLLLDPSAGDVVFDVRASDGTSQRLYAYKSVLAGNNEYFAARIYICRY
jgi:hypothetical protein